jgi:hypothetical protein
MTTRRFVDLDVPAQERQIEELPANVLDFSAPPRLAFAVGPGPVFEIALRQRARETAKAVARHARRTRRRRGLRPGT